MVFHVVVGTISVILGVLTAYFNEVYTEPSVNGQAFLIGQLPLPLDAESQRRAEHHDKCSSRQRPDLINFLNIKQ